MSPLEIHEFFIEGGDRESSHVILNITEPSNEHEALRGYFFALAEFNQADKKEIGFFESLIDEAESAYYERPGNDPGLIFENIIEEINQKSRQILEKKKGQMHCLLGVIENGQVSLVAHGEPEAHLFYPKNDSLQSLPIYQAEETEEQSEEKKDRKFFSSIMSGPVNQGDVVGFITPGVGKYLTNGRLKLALTNRSPRQAAEYVAQILKDVKKGASFGGILIQVVKKMPDLKKINKISEEALEIKNPKETLVEKINISTNYRRQNQSKNILSTIIFQIGKVIVNLILFLYKIIAGIFLLVTNWGGQRQDMLDSAKNWLEEKRGRIKELPTYTKILFVFVVILSILFICVTIIEKIQEEKRLASEKIQLELKSAEDKIIAAEASRIYGDKEKTRALLAEAEVIIKNLESQVEPEKTTPLTSALNQSRENLRGIVQTTSTIFGEAPSASGLAILKDTLFAYGKDNIYKFNLKTKSREIVPAGTFSQLKSGYTPKENSEIIFINGSGLAEINSDTGAPKSINITLPDSEKIKDIAIYNQRLYALLESGLIYRFNRTTEGFDKGQPWFKNEQRVNEGELMAIDGDIFTVGRDGVIKKFTSGNEVAFSVPDLDPQIKSPNEMFTYSDIPYIYILEGAQKRLIVIRKNGELAKQITNESWQNPTGLTVLEGGKKALILDQGKIFEIEI